MWVTTLWDLGQLPLQWGVVVGASLAAAVTDVCHRRIPNPLTAGVFLSGIVWSMWSAGWSGLGDSVTACLLMAVPYVLLFVFAGGGAGDAKLMGALGCWLGVVNAMAALACVSVCGIVLAILYSMRKKKFGQVVKNVWLASYRLLLAGLGVRTPHMAIVQAESSERLKMPYGLAILAGACVAMTGVLIWRS